MAIEKAHQSLEQILKDHADDPNRGFVQALFNALDAHKRALEGFAPAEDKKPLEEVIRDIELEGTSIEKLQSLLEAVPDETLVADLFSAQDATNKVLARVFKHRWDKVRSETPQQEGMIMTRTFYALARTNEFGTLGELRACSPRQLVNSYIHNMGPVSANYLYEILHKPQPPTEVKPLVPS